MNSKKTTKNIMLLDGNLSFAQKVKSSVDLLGYEITVSNNPELAVEAIRKRKFNVVIVDASLPQFSFREFIEVIKQHDNSVPVLATSDNSDLDLKESALASGASDFFLKHFEFDRLLLKIYKLP